MAPVWRNTRGVVTRMETREGSETEEKRELVSGHPWDEISREMDYTHPVSHHYAHYINGVNQATYQNECLNKGKLK